MKVEHLIWSSDFHFAVAVQDGALRNIVTFTPKAFWKLTTGNATHLYILKVIVFTIMNLHCALYIFCCSATLLFPHLHPANTSDQPVMGPDKNEVTTSLNTLLKQMNHKTGYPLYLIFINFLNVHLLGNSTF